MTDLMQAPVDPTQQDPNQPPDTSPAPPSPGDLNSQPDQTPPPSVLPGLDLQGIDQNIQQIQAVHQAWGLPPLPHETMFDLATQQGMNHQDLGNFLWGLASDVHNALNTANSAVNPFSAPAAAADTGLITDPTNPIQTPDTDPNSVHNQLRKLYEGLSGNRAPEIISPDATVDLKRRAIAAGLLDPNKTVLDNTWTPALNNVSYQVLQSDYSRRISGDRPGAVSINTAMHFLNDWMSPSGLGKAAAGLGVIPNLGQAKKTGESWLHGFGDWLSHPLDAGKFLTAITPVAAVTGGIVGGVLGSALGPAGTVIGAGLGAELAGVGASAAGAALQHKDVGRAASQTAGGEANLMLPVVNDILLVSGLGEIIDAGRAAFAGSQGLDAVYNSTNALYNVDRGAQALADAAKPSYLAQKLAGTSIPGVSQIGQGMEAWRNLRAVQLAKVFSGVGIRTGLAAQAEEKLFPQANPAGQSLASVLTPGGINTPADFEKWKNQRLPGPTGALWDMALAPPSFFKPGTFSQLGEVTSNLKNTLTAVSSDKMMASEVANGIAAGMTDPGKRADFLKLAATDPAGAIAQHEGLSRDAVGAKVFWDHVITAVDQKAAETADKYASWDDNPGAWHQAFSNARNGTVSKLVGVDPNDAESFLTRMVAKTPEGDTAAEQWRAGLTSRDPAEQQQYRDLLNTTIQDHDVKRQALANDLISSLKPGDVTRHMQRFYTNDGNWGDFVQAHDTLETFLGHGGEMGAPADLSQLRYQPALSPAGRQLSGTGEIDPANTVSQHLLEIARTNPKAIKDAPFAPLARPILPGQGRMGLQRMDELDKQDALRMVSAYDTHTQYVKDLSWLESNPEAQQNMFRSIQLGMKPEGLTADSWKAALSTIYAGPVTEGTTTSPTAGNAARRIFQLSKETDDSGQPLYDFGRSMSREEFAQKVTQARQDMQQQLDNLNNSATWDQLKIAGDLPSKVKKLRGLSQQMAGRVEGLPDDITNRLAGLGYKVVHGAEYLHPQDIMLNEVRPIDAFTAAERWKMSLGNFVSPAKQSYLNNLYGIRLHSELTDSLGPSGLNVLSNADRTALDVGGENTQSEIVRRMWQSIHDAQEKNGAALNATNGFWRGLPTRLAGSLLPMAPRNMSRADITQAMQGLEGIDGNGAAINAIEKATKRAANLGWHNMGLQALEDHIRTKNLFDTLKVFSKTDPAQALRGIGKGALLGGAGGAAYALGTGQNPITGAEGGAAAGAGFEGASGLGSLTPLRKLAPALSGSSWYRYGYLPDTLAKVRDISRFTLSPFFDLRRYAKSAWLVQTADLPQDVPPLPLNMGLKALDREFGQGESAKAIAGFDSSSKGEYSQLADTEREFTQRGILNFSTKDYMASMHYRLVKAGVDPDQAYNIAKKTLSYGVGRSPLERSVNFIFFPFSFEKKVAMASGKFLADDPSRLMFIHDGLQAYNTLNQKYDLSKEWKDHLPVLADLEKLNAFDHGLSPGELGGINRPILNFFLPQMVGINGDTGSNLQALVKRSLPAYSDVDHLLTDAAEQGHVMFSSDHMTTAAETDIGYTQWKLFKTQLDQVLKGEGVQHGISALSHTSNPHLTAVKQYMDNYRAQLESKYPSFAQSEADSRAKQIKTDSEITLMTDTGAGISPALQQDLIEWRQTMDYMDKALSAHGLSTSSDPETIPPEMFTAMQQYATQLAMRGNGFEKLYKKYYARTWGPISKEY